MTDSSNSLAIGICKLCGNPIESHEKWEERSYYELQISHPIYASPGPRGLICEACGDIKRKEGWNKNSLNRKQP